MADGSTALRAVIYIPVRRDSLAAWTWLRVCAGHCWARRYEIVATVMDGQWDDAVAMVTGGTADVVVIGRWEDAPAGVLRVEAALTSDDSAFRT